MLCNVLCPQCQWEQRHFQILCNGDDRLGVGGTSQYIAMKTMLMEVMKMNNDAKGVTLVIGADKVVRGICRASFL